MQIPGLHGLSPFELTKESVKKFIDDDMVTHACAIAYEALLSLFPFFIFLIALLGFLELSTSLSGCRSARKSCFH
jgi:membrane protein